MAALTVAKSNAIAIRMIVLIFEKILIFYIKILFLISPFIIKKENFFEAHLKEKNIIRN